MKRRQWDVKTKLPWCSGVSQARPLKPSARSIRSVTPSIPEECLTHAANAFEAKQETQREPLLQQEHTSPTEVERALTAWVESSNT